MVNINIEIDKTLHKKIKQKAIDTDTTISDAVRLAIKEYTKNA